MPRLCHLMPLAVGVVFAWTGAAGAATIKVDSYGDSPAACTLRAAVADVDAQGAAATPCIRAGAGPNTIVLPQGSLEMTQAQDIVIASGVAGLTIVGAGESATSVSAIGASRVLEIGAGATVTIRDLTLSAGAAAGAPAGSPAAVAGDDGDGGAILNAGTLVVADSAITDSYAGDGATGTTDVGGNGGDGGAIYNTGTVTVDGDAFVGDGAGIGGQGPDLSGGIDPPGGDGGSGGAIANVGGTATILNSTFSDDVGGAGGEGASGALLPSDSTAGGPGGQGGNGGAIWAVGGMLSITNSTLASNSAGVGGPGGADATTGGGGEGGALAADGSATVVLASDTIVDNVAPGGGGGIAAPTPDNYPYTTAGVFLLDTLLASNAGGNCAASPIGDAGGNLSYGDATCPPTFIRGNPNVGPLQNNGGAVETVALGSGSAALRSGGGCPSSDARGVLRTGACAIGAYQPAPPAVTLGRVRASATSARIGAAIAVNAGSGTAMIRFGTGGRLSSVETMPLGESVAPEPATLVLRGLTPEQTYHYEVWVTTPDGTTSTGVRTLRTGPGPVLSRLRVAPGRLTYSDNDAATTTVQVLRCVAHKGDTCTSYRAAAKTTHHDRAGTNIAALPKLPAGQYELTVTPVFRGVGGATTVSRFTVT
jgi:hypothetical protein